MKNITAYIRYCIFCLTLALFFACQQPGGDVTGSEYMPDMGHSIAYEANYYNYYYPNTWGSESDYYDMAKPRLPVEGTIPRGYAGGPSGKKGDVLAFAPNGSAPYYYDNTDAERTRATAELINNPYHITDAGIAVGKDLYNIYCGICHGSKGDGDGFLVREDGGTYPVQPANFLLPDFIESSNGRYYHSIMYGKGKMGSYTDKLSYEERWQVIHYIRSLQAKGMKVEYNQNTNTLNHVDVPAGDLAIETPDIMANEGGEQSTDDHGSSGGSNH